MIKADFMKEVINLWTIASSFSSKAGNSASASRVSSEKWLNSKYIRDLTAVKCWWIQQLATALQGVQAVVSSWDDLTRPHDYSTGEK